MAHPKPISCIAGALLFFFLFEIPAARGQAPGPQGPGNIELRMSEVKQDFCSERSIQLTVYDESKARLDRQSVAKLYDRHRDITIWQTTSKESEATLCGVDFGDYDLEVTAVGYITDKRVVHITGTLLVTKLDVFLQKDPTAVELSTADAAIPAKLRRDLKHAVDDLKSGNPKDAQKHLEKVYRFAPSSAQVNFLYGYSFLQLKDLEKSETYLSHAAALDPRREQTLTLLGRVQLQRENYEDARKTLEQATLTKPGDWIAHNLLADVYLRTKEYEKARAQARLAIDLGKGPASTAQLTLGQALANVGRDQEALEAFRIFLQTNPNNPTVPQVKDLMARIEGRDSEAGKQGNNVQGRDLVLASSEPTVPPSAWGPPGVDDEKPFVAPDVNCPLDQVLAMTGQQVKQFTDSMAKFAAVEDLLHEQLDAAGTPITKQTRKFDYVAAIKEDHPGTLEVDEYRNERYGIADLPDHIVTTGFVTLALIFHPDMRDNFQMVCEGLGQWKGQPTWIIHFQQREDKPNRIESYRIGDQTYRVDQKGRAWINAGNFQIVRIESDLLKPVQRMTVQHQIAEYGPVHFRKKNIDLWLPHSAELFLEINRRRYYRRHSFDHYMLFSATAQEGPAGQHGSPVQRQ